MSLIDRIFRRRDDSGYAAGVALFEQGAYVEAAGRLRRVIETETADSGSLADFYLRQSLVKEGRRLIGADAPAEAVPFFAEAARRWPKYPDLHFWHGMALASGGAWDEALAAAREALRFNGDYVEARLLEAGCLNESGHREEAAQSLNALLASGRRVDHPLIRYLSDDGPYTADTLPAGLAALVREAIHEKRGDEELASAVELCRSGDLGAGDPQARRPLRGESHLSRLSGEAGRGALPVRAQHRGSRRRQQGPGAQSPATGRPPI